MDKNVILNAVYTVTTQIMKEESNKEVILMWKGQFHSSYDLFMAEEWNKLNANVEHLLYKCGATSFSVSCGNDNIINLL